MAGLGRTGPDWARLGRTGPDWAGLGRTWPDWISRGRLHQLSMCLHRSMGQEDPLEKEMATQSSILAWKVPRTEEPGQLQSMGHKESDTTE